MAENNITTYLKELNYKCNTINKGFIYLLQDNENYFDTFNDVLVKYISTEEINNMIKKYGTEEISDYKQKYFFKHINIFFILKNEYSIKEKNINILSAMCAYLDNPLNYIIKVLNKSLPNPFSIISILKSEKFFYLLDNQLLILNKNNDFILKNISISRDLFDKDNEYLYEKLNYYFDKIKIDNTNLRILINDICDIYTKSLESKTALPSLKSSGNNIIISTNDNNKNEIYEEKENNNNKNNISGKVENILNKFFNPAESYISSTYEKYKELSEKLKYDSKDCRSLKSILYILTYILKDSDNKDFDAAKYMQNIINADVGWAVGDENNKEASFYGNSDIAKFFYGYYSYMTSKENPYTDLINNKIVKEMDYNAILINKYFKENGFANLEFTNEKVKEIYNILVNFKELIKIIDSPISLTGSIDNFISGIISSILNSAATTLDFSISSIVKELFYVEMIPINKKKYSIAQLYNYANFIKLILESSTEFDDIDYIDRDEFINQAYSLLGIKEESLMKIGYLAYDSDMNFLADLNMYSEKLFQNKNNMIFTLRNDMKLLYSLIQFGIQKKSVLTGDINYEKRFIYGNEYSVRDILEYLTDTEIYYVFTLYQINPWTLDDKLGSLTNDEILDFNKDLFVIDAIYDHHSNSFYNVYLDKSPNSLYEEMNDYDFKNTKYKSLINNMYNYYRKILKYNKQQLDNIVFEANDISNIDDFFVRFIPSLRELMKTLGQNTDSLKSISKFLDSLLKFVSDVLFRNLFVNIKISLNDLLKRYTQGMFDKLNEYKFSEEITFDLNLGDSKFMQSIDLLIKIIEKGNFNLFSIQSCFNNNVPYYESGYDPMEEDTLVFNHGHNSISRNEFFDDTDNSLDKSYDGANTDKSPNINKENTEYTELNKNDSIRDTIINSSSEDNKKIYYENGNVIIERTDGSKEIVVSKNDINDINISFVEFPEIAEKNLSTNEYQQLIEIRDYINNITNKQLQYLNKQLTIVKENLNTELNKNIPNYNNIKNLNKTIQKLTSLINDVKKENRILESNNDTSTVIIKDFSNPSNETSESNNYSTLNDFFKNKKEILKEVNEIVIDNDVILTNYQITQLLK